MKKKLTIGLFNDSFFPFADGVIAVLDNYARRLSEYANVIVFVPSYTGVKYDDSKFPYKVVRCKSIKIPTVEYTLPITKLDMKFNIKLLGCKLDIVHIHSPFTIGAAGVRYAQKHNIPVVATMHTQFKKDFLRAVKSEMLANKLNNNLIELFNKCDECWAVNKAVAEIYRDEYGYKTTPRVMNNATEFVPVKDPAKAKKQIDKKYNIKKDEKVFLFVGRINTVKNILFIVESLRNLKDKNPNFKFKMLFVGSGPDEDKLRLCIDELDMKKEIIMCGKVSDREELAKYFSRADLFLFPSVYDCSSIVQIESASQSTPALFLKGTATASTVTDNVNGYLAEHTPEAYADRILEIMKDEKLYKEVCKNSYKDLYRNWNDTVDEAYEIYKELIDKKKGEVE